MLIVAAMDGNYDKVTGRNSDTLLAKMESRSEIRYLGYRVPKVQHSRSCWMVFCFFAFLHFCVFAFLRFLRTVRGRIAEAGFDLGEVGRGDYAVGVVVEPGAGDVSM